MKQAIIIGMACLIWLSSTSIFAKQEACITWEDYLIRLRDSSHNIENKPTIAKAKELFDEFNSCYYEKPDFLKLPSVDVVLIYLNRLAKEATPFLLTNLEVDNELRSKLESIIELHLVVYDLSLELKSKHGRSSILRIAEIDNFLNGPEYAQDLMLSMDFDKLTLNDDWLSLSKTHARILNSTVNDEKRKLLTEFLSVVLQNAERRGLSPEIAVKIYAKFIKEVWYIRHIAFGNEVFNSQVDQAVYGFKKQLQQLPENLQFDMKSEFPVVFEMALPQLEEYLKDR